MKGKTVTISRKKTKNNNEEIDWELVNKFRRALEDIKHGRLIEWKPKTK